MFLIQTILFDFWEIDLYLRHIFVFTRYNWITSLIFRMLFGNLILQVLIRKSSSSIHRYVFTRYNNERKFNYTRLCINVTFFLFLFFCWILRDDRAVTPSSLPFERQLARGKDWVESWRDRFLWYPPPMDAFDQENSSSFVPYLKIYFYFLRARLNARKREAETQIAAQKSSPRANFMRWGNKKRVFFAIKMLSCGYAVQASRARATRKVK